MGSAMSVPARDNGHEVRLVGTPLDGAIIDALLRTGVHPALETRLPPGVSYFAAEQLAAALSGVDAVVGGVSSFGVEWFGKAVLPLLPECVPVLSVTRGLALDADGALSAFPDMLGRMTPADRRLSLNAVGGPCAGDELARRRRTEAVFCGKDADVLHALRALFATGYFHIRLSTDVWGVETAAALKNVYALGASLAMEAAGGAKGEGGAPRGDAQAALLGQAVQEMEKLSALLGCGPEQWTCGPEELYAAVLQNRARKPGALSGRGVFSAQAAEAPDGAARETAVIAGRIAAALRALAKRGLANPADFPMLMHVDARLGAEPAGGVSREASACP